MPEVPFPAPPYLEFLRQWSAAGPWVLTAILPDKKAITTATFYPKTQDALRMWVSRRSDHNIYFHVNTTMRDLNKKADREDIKSVDWLHVDIDPRAGVDLAEERKRALGLLTTDLPEGVPAPTCIIFSGGGYQGFWKLDEPIQIGGDLPKAEDAKLWNVELETRFEADQCHNIDRIMRLPGTTNWPDKRKRDKGRTPESAKLVEFNDQSFPLSVFKQAEAVETAGAAKPTEETAAPVVKVEGRKELESLGLKAAVVEMIVEGQAGVRRKGGDDSNSGRLWMIMGEMMRGGLSDEQIYQIIINPKFASSKFCESDAAVWRQIGHARRKNPAGKLPRLPEQIIRINRTYFAALTGTKIRYFREEPNDTLVTMQKEAFLFETAPILYRGDEDKAKQANTAWLKSNDRRYFKNGFALDPDGTADDVYNLWKGFAVEPAPGDWSLMRRHIERILAGGDAVAAKYIIDWTAWAFQNPATPPRVALVFSGGEGVGKGIFARSLCDIFGPVHAKQITSGHHFTGHFNAHLRNLCLLFADEAIAAGSTEEGTLKGLITEATMPIEAKGVDVDFAENHLHIIMATNNEWAVPISHDGRRYAIFNVSDAKQKNLAYFSALASQMADGGLAAMLFDLLAHDLSNFNPEGCRPDTEGTREQKVLSLSPADQCFLGWLESGALPGTRIKDGVDGEGVVIYGNHPSRLGIYNAMREASPRLYNESEKYLGGRLRRDLGAIRYNAAGHRGWSFQTLKDTREIWFKKHRHPTSWPTDGEEGWSTGTGREFPEHGAE